MIRLMIVAVLLSVVACKKSNEVAATETKMETAKSDDSKKVIPAGVKPDTAIFAGGCFWCMEGPFEKLDGVFDAISGYTGGHKLNPTYGEVGSGTTGHRESVEIIYDPAKISYEQLLNVFWRQIDPTDDGGQFVDRGFQYTSAVFYLNESQKNAAEKSKDELSKSGKFTSPVVTPILPASTYYPAEDYHQDFYKKDPDHYHRYRSGSGRDQFIEKTWGSAH